MADGDVVATKEVVVFVHVREWLVDEVELQYDWINSHGDESDELYDNPETAMREGLNRLD